MARVTYVKKAQQRYQMVPVIDPATGQQKQTPVMDRNGQQKVSKRGPVFMKVTKEDRSKPLPPRKCENCGNEIAVGTPYKHISPKSGPYGGRTRYRCGDCPTWQVWDYSNSLSARTAQIAYEFNEAISDASDMDTVQEALNNAASAVRDIASEKEESAQNIEQGFGHETSTSQELADVAEQLNSWADEIEGADIPEFPEPEESECEDCGGTGEVDGEDAEGNEISDATCETCDGTGQHTPDEPTEDQIEEWRSEVQDALTIVDECPV